MVKVSHNIRKLEHMAELLKAVAHPLRISIIDILIQKDEMTVTEIHSLLNIPQPEASRQLTTLKNAGIVNCKKEGTARIYFLVDKSISNLLDCVENCSIK